MKFSTKMKSLSKVIVLASKDAPNAEQMMGGGIIIGHVMAQTFNWQTISYFIFLSCPICAVSCI